MIIVADTGPLNYLVLVDCVHVLSRLYANVAIPEMVAEELRRPQAPPRVRDWIAQKPEWLLLLPDPRIDEDLARLDPGEAAAIALAEQVGTRELLMDDWLGRRTAFRRGLIPTGTLGVLGHAHRAGLADFETSLRTLKNTNFRISPEVESELRARLGSRPRRFHNERGHSRKRGVTSTTSTPASRVGEQAKRT